MSINNPTVILSIAVNPNFFLLGPTSGGSALPTFRLITLADLTAGPGTTGTGAVVAAGSPTITGTLTAGIIAASDTSSTPTITGNKANSISLPTANIAVVGNVGTSLGSGTGRNVGVIGIGRANADVGGDFGIGGWFHSESLNSGNSEIGVRCQVHEATAGSIPFQVCTGALATPTEIARIDGTGGMFAASYNIEGGGPIASSNLADVVGWTNYVPAISAGSGSFTSVAATGRYYKIGKLVHFQVRVTVTTVGSAAGATIISLPFTSGSTGVFALCGQDELTAQSYNARINTGVTSFNAVKYDGSFGLASGSVLDMSGFYESST
jgi:hypothetical protein